MAELFAEREPLYKRYADHMLDCHGLGHARCVAHLAQLADLVEPEETDYHDPYMHNTKMTWYPYAEDDDMQSSPAPTNGEGEPLPSDD